MAATTRAKRRLRGTDAIAMRVGKVINKYKMAKHFDLDISDAAFSYRRDEQAIAAEAALDGLYIVRTSLADDELDAEATVRAYKGLSVVERAFRSYKTVDLKIRSTNASRSSRRRSRRRQQNTRRRQSAPKPTSLRTLLDDLATITKNHVGRQDSRRPAVRGHHPSDRPAEHRVQPDRRPAVRCTQ